MLVAIETSCDESAVAILDLNQWPASHSSHYLKADLISSQAKLHEPYGGVVPELAAREHIANLPHLFTEALRVAGISAAEISAVAVTRGPGLNGSLLVGLMFAKAFAFARTIPLIPVNHLEGHLWAGELLSTDERPRLPYLALVVSGGHTFLTAVTGLERYRVLAKTRDDAAGECFDKVATLLGLPYPGGPELARLAEGGDPRRFPLPLSLPNDQTSFSFSGLKTAVSRLVTQLGADLEMGEEGNSTIRRDLAASVQYAIVQNLLQKTVTAAQQLGVRDVVLSGGVAANLLLRESLQAELSPRGIRLVTPPARWCTDNAAMIGVVAVLKIFEEPARYLDWRAAPVGLGPGIPFDIAPLPRWPIDSPGRV